MLCMQFFRFSISGLLAVLLIAGCSEPSSSQVATPTAPASPPPLATTVILGDGRVSDLPAVQAYRARIVAALAAPPYVLLRDDLAPDLAAAQLLAVEDARVRLATRTSDGKPLRSEVMTVAPARAGDVPPALVSRCPPAACDRIVLYVYPTNTTISVIVSDRGRVLDVQTLVDAQPEIPPDLADLAVQIALNDPQVAAAFEGLTPDAAMAAMSATKTALADTSCERSRHLCVAPVFTWGDAALWAIVDLTDFRLVAATTWTDQGATARRRASEATLQDAAIAPLCETPQQIERDGWSATYRLTSSDGLELRDVRYRGRLILASAKVVDWHVGYEGTDDRRVGFNDAIGCPVFSQAAVIPYSLPTLVDVGTTGFVLEIVFRSPDWPRPCNYQYVLRAFFGGDGELTILAENQGRGCGTNGVYHPVLRLEPPPGTRVTMRDGGTTSRLEREGQTEWPVDGIQHLLWSTPEVRLEVSPLWGDAELAYLYWTRARDAEGRSDLPSIGQCCALNADQGPEQFVDGEDLGDEPVFWYVPRIRNAEGVRCWADMELVDGMLVPQIWPCRSGVVLAGADGGSP
jgi:hypothetical protein